MRAALLAVLASLAFLPAARAVEDPGALRKTVETPGDPAARLKAAAALAKADPEGLGQALQEIAKAKRPDDLPFLVDCSLRQDVRHLRLLGVHAAYRAAPAGVVAAFREKTGADDVKHAVRAIEAVGLLAGPLKDKASTPRLLEIVKGPAALQAIEACRALSRIGDKGAGPEVIAAVTAINDNHVRKHACWTAQDLVGRKIVEARLTALKSRPGDVGKRAAEGIEILLDREEDEFEWDAGALEKVPAWWEKQRTKSLKTVVDIGDKTSREQVQGFLDDMAKNAAPWNHLVGSVFAGLTYRQGTDSRMWDAKKRILLVNAAEIVQCAKPWQGEYLLARNANIILGELLGEPPTGHRAWEQAYVEIHSFMLLCKQPVPDVTKYVEEMVAKKPWR